jgi:activator of HSP90 ATPase
MMAAYLLSGRNLTLKFNIQFIIFPLFRVLKYTLMAKHIVQKVVFKKTKPKALYDLYMNAKQHSLIAGSPVKVSAKNGAPFSAWGGYITGTNLQLVKDKLIVQTCRGSDWDAADSDSTFTIVLEPKGKDVVLHAIHANVPDVHAGHLAKGWYDHYWNPWKQHLAGKKIKRPAM